jgi:hypothetical protein
VIAFTTHKFKSNLAHSMACSHIANIFRVLAHLQGIKSEHRALHNENMAVNPVQHGGMISNKTTITRAPIRPSIVAACVDRSPSAVRRLEEANERYLCDFLMFSDDFAKRASNLIIAACVQGGKSETGEGFLCNVRRLQVRGGEEERKINIYECTHAM